MWSAPTPNSQCASMTSSPLFISVAESIVILRPICQVGCRSAASGRTAASAVASEMPERPTRRGEHQPAHVGAGRGRAGTGEWRCARCPPASTARPCARRGLRHERPGHDQHFLVGERDASCRPRSPPAPPRAPPCPTTHTARCRRPGCVAAGQEGPRRRRRRRGADAPIRARVDRRPRPSPSPASDGAVARHLLGQQRRRCRPRPAPPRAGDRDARPPPPARSGRSTPSSRESRGVFTVSSLYQVEVEGGRREEQRVDAIEHAAVARDDRAAVLHARFALQLRFEQVARDADSTTSTRGRAWPATSGSSGSTRPPASTMNAEPNTSAARRALDRLLRADGGRQRMAAQRAARVSTAPSR